MIGSTSATWCSWVHPDEIGIRPIEAIVAPSGHRRFLALTGPLSAPELVEHLCDIFPEYGIQTESGEGLLAVSVHPDLDPDEVAFEVVLWFEEQGVLPSDHSVGITEPLASEVGPLREP